MKCQILSPAGDIKSLNYAVAGGADAVYLGMQKFNARAKADNFSAENLKEYVDFCHLYGVKVYVAFNTSIKDTELPFAKKEIIEIALSGVDGIIVADIGLFPLLNETAPSLPIHISTQAGVHNVLSAGFFEGMGADRVVLARETTKADIKDIKKHYPSLELEYFVQGALCVCFSGGCLLSSMTGGGSGNRGSCSQPCRLRYSLENNGKTYSSRYMLSTADLNLSAKLDELTSLGISAFKIEGRLRRAEYVGQATLSYRKIRDKESTPQKELPFLKRVFNRGDYSEGYIFSPDDKIMYPLVPSSIGEHIGKVEKTLQKGGYSYAEITSKLPLVQGDGLKILRNGEEVGGADLHSVESPRKNRYLIPISSGAKVGDEVHITSSKTLSNELEKLERKLPISLICSAKKAQRLSLTLNHNNISVSYSSDFVVPAAKNAPMTMESIKNQLTKLNQTPFSAQKIDIIMDNGIFIPVGELNSLRREGVRLLRDKIISSYTPIGRKNLKNPPFEPKKEFANKNSLTIELQHKSQLCHAIKNADNIVYSPNEYKEDSVLEFFEEAKKYTSAKIFVAPPRIIKKQDIPIVNSLITIIKNQGGGLLADNLGLVKLARDNGLSYGVGIGLNLYNSNMLAILGDASFAVCSPELSIADTQKLVDKGASIYAYGRVPVMTLAHCPIKVATKKACSSCEYKGEFYYKDERERELPTTRKKLNSCSFTVYNHEIKNHISLFQKEGACLYLNMFSKSSLEISDILAQNGGQS